MERTGYANMLAWLALMNNKRLILGKIIKATSHRNDEKDSR